MPAQISFLPLQCFISSIFVVLGVVHNNTSYNQGLSQSHADHRKRHRCDKTKQADETSWKHWN